MQLVSLQEPVCNPRTEVNVVEIIMTCSMRRGLGRGVLTGSRSSYSEC